jgi:hypothetical protein
MADMVKEEGFKSFRDIVDDQTLKSKHSRISWLTDEDCQRHKRHPELGQHFKGADYTVCCLRLVLSIYGREPAPAFFTVII